MTTSTQTTSSGEPNSAATTELATSLAAGRKKRARQYWALVTLLVIAVIGVWLASLMIGETFNSLLDVLAVVMSETVPGASFTVGALRLPRATVAIFVGLAFGIAGTIFQTMLRNQLASPDIIGISASASAAGATGIIMFGLGQTAVSIMSTIASGNRADYLSVVYEVWFYGYPHDPHRYWLRSDYAGVDFLCALACCCLGFGYRNPLDYRFAQHHDLGARPAGYLDRHRARTADDCLLAPAVHLGTR